MKKWYKEGFIYQIYPMSFCDSNGDGIGDLQGIISKIPYIKNLGVSMVWLSPIYPSPMKDNGYDVAEYKDINPMFGTMDDFLEMLDKFHEENIKVIMDLVINHTSSEHHWFKEAIKNKNSKYHDYYIFKDKPNNWTSFFGGSTWEYNKATNEYYFHAFDVGQPDLNWESSALRKEIKDIIRFWLDLGVDGFRLDTINLLSKNPDFPDGNPNSSFIGIEHYANGPHLHDYLKELNLDVFSKYDCVLIGEAGGQTLQTLNDFTNDDRHELNMVFQFDLFGIDGGKFKWMYHPFTFVDIKHSFNKWQKTYNEHKLWNTLVLENHDQSRCVSRFGSISYRYASSTLLATYAYLMTGTPFIYQGQEIGMVNCKFNSIDEFKDVESINIFDEAINIYNYSKDESLKALNYISRDHARTPMQWDDSVNAGFSKGKPWIKVNPNYLEINVKKDLESEDSVYKYYQKLIQLKNNSNALTYGYFLDLMEDKNNVILYKKYDEIESYYIVGNTLDVEQEICLPFNGELVLNNYHSNNPKFKPFEIRVYKEKKVIS